tara:strand:- start:520 stop:702 length:183 start_codon:yes stop_codon:yes gene_type:complete
MQLKFNQQRSFKQTLIQNLLKFFAILLLIVVAIFFIEKINFPHPKNDIKQNITNEIIKLK